MQIKSRHHLRSDTVSELQESLGSALGVTIDGDRFELVELESGPFDVILVDDEPLLLYYTEADTRRPFLTVKGANAYTPTRQTVVVDAGAVSFVSDGADVMRPGVVEADEDIVPEDLVVIQEETHNKALAIGKSRVPGTDLLGTEGKVIDSIHHVGDELYAFSP